MAFDVTPTSGAGPYTFSIDFLNKESLDANLYEFEARPRTATGSCPAPATTGSRSTGAENAFLMNDEYVTLTDVAPGSCFVVTVLIRNTQTGDVVSQASANVDNV